MECANCYIPNRDIPDLDKNKLFNFYSAAQRTYIRLIGAEPINVMILFRLFSTKSLGHRPSVTTNGLKMAQRDYKELKRAGLRLLLHSMNGADCDEAYKQLDMGKWATVKVSV